MKSLWPIQNWAIVNKNKNFKQSLSVAIDSQDEPRAQNNMYERESGRNLIV